MTKRPYINNGVVDLEGLFETNQSDQSVLKALKHELEFRKTKRAKSLLGTVLARLEHLGATSPNKPEPVFEPVVTGETEMISETPLETTEFDSPDVEWHTVLDADVRSSAAQNEPAVKQKPIEDYAPDILDAWTVLEALSPQSFRNPKDLVIGTGSVAHFGADQLPWEIGEKAAPRKQLYYLVYLGSVDLAKTSADLLQLYKDDRQEIPSVQGNAALAVIVVDKKGVPLGDNALAVSSYGWSYGRAMTGVLDDLKYWDKAEGSLQEGLEKILIREDEDGNTEPLDRTQIQTAYKWLVRNCTLPNGLVNSPNFAIRLLNPFGRSQPEPPLLNSFYLKDLQRAKALIATSGSGQALRAYLGLETPENRHDLLIDLPALQSVLEPKSMPLGRWPVQGRFPLVLLQQAAVNIAHTILKHDGLFSVNGPPGTGKTTLLRDVVASVVIDRAIAMNAFEHPQRAFTRRGSMNARGKVDLFELDPSLKGYEILVASSNNKAVENISKELPLVDAIDAGIELNYFKPLCDSLLPDNEASWGLVATVLGNSKNRSTFVNNAWWEYDTSLHSYFTYMNGSLDLLEDDDGEPIIPSIASDGDPPQNAAEALDRWHQVRQEFQVALKNARLINAIAQEGLEAKKSLIKIQELLTLFGRRKEGLKADTVSLSNTISASESQVEIEDQKRVITESELNRHVRKRPGWWSRLFGRAIYKKWKHIHSRLNSAESEQWQVAKQARETLVGHQKSLQKLQEKSQTIIGQEKSALEQQSIAQKRVTKTQQICGDKLVTREFLNTNHHDRQTSTPVFSQQAHLIRDELFIASMRLHKAFIDAAATPIRQNLAAFMAVLGNKRLPSDSASLLRDIWSTGFMISPVFSTAFASIDRMLNSLPSESIGWLLIDEAGQATPQQAIGAIMRSKRVMAVGDPLQIEPVVTTPKPLLEGIASYMGVDHFKWIAPEASVQSVADRANPFGATIDHGLRTLWIGSPLLVHRRCEEPMFTISNQLAYSGQMVKATIDKSTDVASIMGSKTEWFDVTGQGDNKWSAAEGELVVGKILAALAAVGTELELFVISPFRIVAQRMQDRMRQEVATLDAHGIADPVSWIRDNIGTVHTFQGKEAETVIFMLGAPNANQIGARNWAGSSVNLLNVAVSRAKRNFYIVGNQALWRDVGKMPVLVREMAKFIRTED